MLQSRAKIVVQFAVWSEQQMADDASSIDMQFEPCAHFHSTGTRGSTSRHDTAPFPPLVVGVAVGTDIAIVVDMLGIDCVGASDEDREEVAEVDGTEVVEDVGGGEVETSDEEEAAVLEDVDDAFDDADVDGTLNDAVLYWGAAQLLGGVSLATTLNGLLIDEVVESLMESR